MKVEMRVSAGRTVTPRHDFEFQIEQQRFTFTIETDLAIDHRSFPPPSGKLVDTNAELSRNLLIAAAALAVVAEWPTEECDRLRKGDVFVQSLQLSSAASGDPKIEVDLSLHPAGGYL